LVAAGAGLAFIDEPFIEPIDDGDAFDDDIEEDDDLVDVDLRQ
jgi:hypothetical protein